MTGGSLGRRWLKARRRSCFGGKADGTFGPIPARLFSVSAKPVPRWEYLFGKLLGVLVLLAISIAVMALLFVSVFHAREQTVLNETTRQLSAAPQEQLRDALDAVRANALRHDVFFAVAAIFLKACVLAALTLFVSTFATTNLFTVFVMIAVYFIGHLQATAREFWLTQQSAGWLTKSLLAIVALIFPDLQAFNLADEVVAGAAIALAVFTKIGLLGIFYVVIYTLATTFAFYGKEL